MNQLQLIFAGLLGISGLATIIGYPRKYGALSGRSRLFRTLGLVIINLLFILLISFCGTDFKAVPNPNEGKIRAAIYLALFGVLIISLLLLAVLDLLESLVVYRRERREAMQHMVHEVVTYHKERQNPQTPGATPGT